MDVFVKLKPLWRRCYMLYMEPVRVPLEGQNKEPKNSMALDDAFAYSRVQLTFYGTAAKKLKSVQPCLVQTSQQFMSS